MEVSINRISNLFNVLVRVQNEGHLKEFEFKDQSWDILRNKTDKQIRFINALLMKDNWNTLQRVFREWGIPKSQEYFNLLSEENLKINKYE